MARKGAKGVRSIASRLYIRSIQHRMGDISLGKLQKHFTKSDSQDIGDYWNSNSRRFYKNIRGSEIKDEILINAIESELPGSKYLLFHPLWTVLEESRCSSERVYELMHLLPVHLQSIIFKPGKNDRKDEMRNWNSHNKLHKIAISNDLNALSCLLLLLRDTELNEIWHRYTNIKWFAAELLSRLIYFEPIRSIADDLCAFINKAFISHNNPLPEEKKIVTGTFSDLYQQPSTIEAHFSNDRISGLLWHARSRGFTSDSRESEIRFVYMAHAFGITKVENAMKYEATSESTELLMKLMEAYNSRYFINKLPQLSIFN